jgi:hypothetical protein
VTVRVLVSVLALSLVQAQRSTVLVTVARANVRQTPSERAEVVKQVEYGTELELIRTEGDWFHVYVSLNGNVKIEGYLSRRVAIAASGDAAPVPRLTAPTLLAEGIAMAADAGGKTTWLDAVAVRTVPIATEPASFDDLAKSGAIEQAATGRAALGSVTEPTWVWLVERDRTPPAFTNRRPAFFASYKGAPHVNVSELTPAIVKLTPAGKWAIAAMLHGPADASWTLARDLKQDVVKVQVVAGATAAMDVRLAAPLAPGEYALVLRPAFQRLYPATQVLSGEAIGAVMSVAWPFTIR